MKKLHLKCVVHACVATTRELAAYQLCTCDYVSAIHVPVVSQSGLHSLAGRVPPRHQATESTAGPWDWRAQTLWFWKVGWVVGNWICVVSAMQGHARMIRLYQKQMCISKLTTVYVKPGHANIQTWNTHFGRVSPFSIAHVNPLYPGLPITTRSFFLLCDPRPPSSCRLPQAPYWHLAATGHWYLSQYFVPASK